VTDLARLQIRVDALEAKTAERDLAALEKQGNRTERSTDRLSKTYKRFGVVVGAALSAAIVGSASKLVGSVRQFEVLNARLITATGSAENASMAFDALKDFAATTPFALEQSVEAFTRLVNLGLTPSEAALRSYGNTASAMGADLNQLIEAVADAATGEFERLREFGITARSEGDRVSFTFRGITTTVGKNAAEIEGFLQSLGENEFAGAMLERMNTLDGAISNLNDEWNKVFTNIGNAGIGDLIEGFVRQGIGALEELNLRIDSGELEGRLRNAAILFDGYGEDIATTAGIISELFDDLSKDIGDSADEGVVSFDQNFRHLPINVKAIIEILGTELAAFVDRTDIFFDTMRANIESRFTTLKSNLGNIFDELADLANPFSNSNDFLGNTRTIAQGSAERLQVIQAEAKRRREISDETRLSIISGIIEETDAVKSAFAEQGRALDKQLEDARNKRNAAGGDGTDRLAGFRVGGDGDSGPTDAETKLAEQLEKETERKRKAQLKQFEDLQDSLRTEEEVISDSYNARLQIILDNTVEGTQKRNDLLAKLNADFAEQAVGDLRAPDTFAEQLAEIEQFYQARRDLILENVQLTESARTELEAELTAQRNERIALLEQQRTGFILSSAGSLFSGLAEVAGDFAGEQNELYRTLFAASKAFAIAESVVSIQQGIANAAALPFPANLSAIASVVAATGSIVSTIQSTQFAGAFDNGGRIPSGRVGLVGEVGPELVRGPAVVTSRRKTADLIQQAANMEERPMQAPASAGANIKIVNVLDPAEIDNYMQSENGQETIVNAIRATTPYDRNPRMGD